MKTLDLFGVRLQFPVASWLISAVLLTASWLLFNLSLTWLAVALLTAAVVDGAWFLVVRTRDAMRAANEPVRIRVKPDVRPFRRQLRRSMRRVPPSLDERDGHHRGKSARTDMTP